MLPVDIYINFRVIVFLQSAYVPHTVVYNFRIQILNNSLPFVTSSIIVYSKSIPMNLCDPIIYQSTFVRFAALMLTYNKEKSHCHIFSSPIGSVVAQYFHSLALLIGLNFML